jgi:uncharacterized protein YndB with AHSA1/START domain
MSDDEMPLTFAAGPSDPITLADEPGTWVELHVDAPPERVWELVTDIELPARFSREFQGASWNGDGPRPGASFVGRNEHPRVGRWQVECFVEHHEPNSRFGWAVADHDRPAARWRFDLAPDGEGTRLRFSVSLGPGPSGLTPAIEAMPDKEPLILRRRLEEHRGNMTATVEGIRRLAEALP